MNREQEIWKPIPEWEDLYEVSNFGRVRSILTGKIRALDTNNYGYKRIHCYRGGGCKKYFIHQLVAKLFVAGYQEGYVVNHKDGNKQNNHYTNLEWVSRTDNNKHAIKTGLKQRKRSRIVVDVKYPDGHSDRFESIVAAARHLGLCEKRVHHLFKTANGFVPELGVEIVKVSEYIFLAVNA